MECLSLHNRDQQASLHVLHIGMEFTWICRSWSFRFSTQIPTASFLVSFATSAFTKALKEHTPLVAETMFSREYKHQGPGIDSGSQKD